MVSHGRHHHNRSGVIRLRNGKVVERQALSATRWEADVLQDRIGAPDIAVVPIVAVVGGVVPGGQVTAQGVTVVPARRLAGLLRSLPPTLTPQRAREVAAQMNRRRTPTPAVDA